MTSLTTNGHTGHVESPTNPALVEYSAAVEQQKATDAALAAARFTGSTQDQVTGDFIVWAAGAIVGWAKTPQEAAQRAHACIVAEAAHPQPVTLTTTRDELPCSVEFQRSSKGEAYWTLKSYCAPGNEAAAAAKLQDLDADLARKYRPDLLAS